MRRSYFIAAGVAVVVGGWILSGQLGGDEAVPSETESAKFQTQSAGEALVRVRVQTSHAQPRENELTVLGRTEASRSVELRAETSGRIVKLKAEKGDRVEKGQVIAEIALDDRMAQLKEAQALVRQREIEYQASKELSSRNFRSKVKLAEGQANLDASKAVLERIRLDIRRTKIKAPFSGVLESRPIELGDVVSVGGPVATIVDLTPVLVTGDVTEQEVGYIRPGLIGVARLVTGKAATGSIRFVSSSASDLTRTFTVELEIPNDDGAVVEGITAEMKLKVGTVQAHKVTPAVLTLSKDGRVGVKSIDAGNRVQFHPIKIVGEDRDGMWLTGLPDQLQLITIGQEFVAVGQKVDPVPAADPKLSELKE